MAIKVKDFLISRDETIKNAMRRLSETGQKQLFVIDKNKVLFGALSDGDIRKWILKGGKLNERAEKICNRDPRKYSEHYDMEKVRAQMLELKINAVPVVSDDGRVKDVLTWDGVFAGNVKHHHDRLDAQVVIMAGGKGTRLDPFTRVLPKPLIPMGDKPIIELIMDRFHEYAIKEFYVSVNYKARLIKSYFDEENSPYNIKYIDEDRPLGTIGSLKLVESRLRDPFIVTNCDVLIDVDYAELVRFHREMKADLTMTVSCRHYVIPYGVCEIENGGHLKSINEKPEYDLLINTGLYVISKKVLSLIPKGRKFDFNELADRLRSRKMRVAVFPVPEKAWVDVGEWAEYQKAVKHLLPGQGSL
jgi:dTDP-glucose pyrophosphorylase